MKVGLDGSRQSYSARYECRQPVHDDSASKLETERDVVKQDRLFENVAIARIPHIETYSLPGWLCGDGVLDMHMLPYRHGEIPDLRTIPLSATNSQ